MLETHFTVAEIEEMLVDMNGGVRTNIFVPNVSWSIVDYEIDLLQIDRNGYATEYEIKRSYSDFLADLKKNEGAHQGDCIYKFYYVVPKSIVDKVLDKLREIKSEKEIPAILAYDENGMFSHHGGTPYIYQGRKMFLEEQLKIAKLANMRYWKLRNKNFSLPVRKVK